jgi:hypothetical protein
MRTFCLVSGCSPGWLAFPGPAAAQTVVEYGAASKRGGHSYHGH